MSRFLIAALLLLQTPTGWAQSISAPARTYSSSSLDSLVRQIPSLATPVSVNVDQEVRKSFQDIGKLAGVGILFDRRVPTELTAKFKVEGIAAVEALNALSLQTGNNLLLLGGDTIIVAREGKNFPGLDLELPNRDITTASVYPGFNPQPTSLPALDINGPVRDAFATIARSAGLSVVFDRDYRDLLPARLKLDNADIYSALDALCAQTRTFWMPYSGNMIFVTDDNSTKHRSYDLRMVKTFYLSNLKSPEEINSALTELRRILPTGGSGGIFALPQLSAIVVVDTPKTVALATKLIARLDSSLDVRADTELTDSAGNLSIVEPGALRNITPYHSALQPRKRTISLDASLPTHEMFEKLAASAGVSVVYDSNLRFTTPSTMTLKLDDVDFFAALDILSLQTRTFWTPLDGKTIFVANELSTNRRDYDPQIVKIFPLKHTISTKGLNEIVNVLRQAIHLEFVFAYEHTNSIVIRDNPEAAALAEVVIMSFDKEASGTASSSASIPPRSSVEMEFDAAGNIFVRDALGMHNITPVRNQMRPTVSQPVTMQIKADARASFEALARNGGLQIQFDSRFMPGEAVNFQVEGENVYDALNLLALQTRSFWQMTDSGTITVAPGTWSIRQELETRIQKSIPLFNIKDPADITALAVLVRSVLSIPELKPNQEMHAIEISAPASKSVLAEMLIAALDVP